jgi:hypothetical protein
VYFFVAGVSIGVVVGFLFPSVWRAFRRKFRNTKRFATALPAELLASPLSQFDETLEEADARQALAAFPIEALFVHARSLVQGKNPRDAVQVYLDILGDERVSKSETNRALFELAQTYALVGLFGRAFDVGFELLSRKTKHRQVFEFLLSVIAKSQRYDRVLEILPVWRGDADAKLRLRIAHAVCDHGENLLRSGNAVAARDVAALATRWSYGSARARLALWEATSSDVLAKMGPDVRQRWIAFAADLDSLSRILGDVRLSPMASSSHIFKIMDDLSKDAQSLEAFSDIESEFRIAAGLSRVGEKSTRGVVDDVVLYALLPGVQDWTDVASKGVGVIAGAVCSGLMEKMATALASLDVRAGLVFLRGLKTHQCSLCGGVAQEFSWACPHCGERETLALLSSSKQG